MFKLLKSSHINPVLVDVGAAGGAPRIWRSLAPHSTLIAFDPDLREMSQSRGGRYHRHVVFNRAVTHDTRADEVEFHLTSSPYCSSTLPPDLPSLSDYSIHDLFLTEGRVRVPAITLDAALAQLQLDRIDWLKLDTQGIDLRLFQSLSDPVRSGILALDMEPGLIAAYSGEDMFMESHRYMLDHGFWLSDLKVCGAARVRSTTLQVMNPEISTRQFFAQRMLKKSPAWCEARYLRTLDAIAGSSREEHVLLWTFAMLDDQHGFALDLALAYEKMFGPDEISTAMRQHVHIKLRPPFHYSIRARLMAARRRARQQESRTE